MTAAAAAAAVALAVSHGGKHSPPSEEGVQKQGPRGEGVREPQRTAEARRGRQSKASCVRVGACNLTRVHGYRGVDFEPWSAGPGESARSLPAQGQANVGEEEEEEYTQPDSTAPPPCPATSVETDVPALTIDNARSRAETAACAPTARPRPSGKGREGTVGETVPRQGTGEALARPTPLPKLSMLDRKLLAHRERARLDALPVESYADRDRKVAEETATASNAVCAILFPSDPITVGEVLHHLHQCHVAAADTMGIVAAVQWGENFQFAPETVARDLADFRAQGSSLPALARSRRARAMQTSFSVQRVEACFGIRGERHPEFGERDFRRLRRMAELGVQIPLPPRFVPSPEPSQLRAKYLAVQGAIHKLINKQVTMGTIVLLPLLVAAGCAGIHLQNAQHHALKKGKASGRSVSDTANVEDPERFCPLNGHTAEEKKQVNEACKQMYGEIHHPTLQDLMRMVTAEAAKHGWENLYLWKMDLKGAFNLLWFDPDAVPLLAFPLAHELVAIHLVGLFGWSGMPFAFNLLTRALHVLVTAVIVGCVMWYVDDCMGCSPSKKTAQSDMTAAHTAITQLAGDEAVAEDKNECGRALDWIGWWVDLDTRSVSVSDRNLLKAGHAFFSCDPARRLSRMQVERMASLASRISVLCRFMRPYTCGLLDTLRGFPDDNPAVQHHISRAAQCDIAMWRAFLVILHKRGHVLRRRIDSFGSDEPTVVFRYDASLTQLAVGVYRRDKDGSEELLRFAAHDLPFRVDNDSGRQNTFEYMAVLLGLSLAATCGLRDFAYALHGDSVSSLAWVSADRAVSSFARRTNAAVVVLSIHLNARVAETVHVPGVDNVVYDGLSRGKSASEVGLDPTKQVHLAASHPAVEILRLCDPAIPLASVSDHLSLTGDVARLVRTLFDPGAPLTPVSV